MKHFIYKLSTPKPAHEVFNLLLDIDKWWVGFHEETISGSSQKIGDEFTFHAGGGMHITKQKLVELTPNKKIAWLVTESSLSFLNNTKEWDNTRLVFDIDEKPDGITTVQFTHEGLAPQIECYDQCTSAWTQYLEQLKTNLNKT